MHPDLKEIEEAAAGLLFISESDHPLETVELKGTGVEEELRSIAGKPAMDFEKITLEHFFRNMTKVYPGESKEQAGRARRFSQLQHLLKNRLKNVMVYRIGSIQVDAFIIGQLNDGKYGGLRTKLVET
jgi:hypothetical protein